MTKLVPSPDWFVGLDSLELCSQGAFVESVITEASPLDGGTDNGFTFTSPNWATQPQDSVFAITSTYPAHPAGSFNYPHLTRLPTIAVYSLTKVRFYFITLFICYLSCSYILASGVFFGAELRSNSIKKWSCNRTNAREIERRKEVPIRHI